MDNQVKMAERVATLEEQVEAQGEQLDEANKKLDELLLKFTRYEGWWGGIFAIGSAVLVFAKFAWADLKSLFTGAP
jgi:uncharacterized membrane protein YjjP (DUF1212 family)